MPKDKDGKKSKRVGAIRHEQHSRTNNPTAETEGLVTREQAAPVAMEYPRNTDLDPQLVWTGKDAENLESLRVDSTPIYIQEKISPKAIIENLKKRTEDIRSQKPGASADLFSEEFNGLPEDARVQFYQHQQKWANRMILGDSLKVMTSLAHKEGLKGAVQCIYMDPPYGIKFASNWQPSTKSRAVSDKDETGEAEMIQAYRDTWDLKIHSYLSYLRDRLTVAHDLLTESGSIFVQISDENIHLVRCLMDEIFGRENFFSMITFTKTNPLGAKNLARTCDYLIWYAKDKGKIKYKPVFLPKKSGQDSAYTNIELKNGMRRKMTRKEKTGEEELPEGSEPFSTEKLFSTGWTETCFYDFEFNGRIIHKGEKSWRTNKSGMERLIRSGRIHGNGKRPGYVLKFSDFSYRAISHLWTDSGGASNMIYAVQTAAKIIQRCLMMTTDPGDLVLDPTCGSGTTASVAEHWGRRWITIDTSRVALTLARTRLMGNSYPYYLLQDSEEGAKKEAEISGKQPHNKKYAEDVMLGFVCKRAPHITLRDIANNSQIDEIHLRYQDPMEDLRRQLNSATGNEYAEWEVPFEAEDSWDENAIKLHSDYDSLRQSRRQDIDQSISQNADYETLHDQPYEARNAVRVSGPFTVESLSPHRILPLDYEQNSDGGGGYM